MRLGAITDEISQDLGYALAVMAEYDCRNAELRSAYGASIVDADEGVLSRIDAELKRSAMQVCCVDTPIFENVPTSEWGDDSLLLLQRAIDVCRRLDSPYIRIFSFPRRGPFTVEAGERIADALARASEVAARAGVTLLLENAPASTCGTGKEAARMIETIGSPALKLLWNPGNAFLAGEQPFPSGYQSARPHIAHIHMKDVRVKEDGSLEPTVVGEGEIRYAEHLAELKADGYAGVLTLEMGGDPTSTPADVASRRHLDALQKMITLL